MTYFIVKSTVMKIVRVFVLLTMVAMFHSSCSLFKPKYGCPSNGKNVGAESLLSSEKAPKAKKFKS